MLDWINENTTAEEIAKRMSGTANLANAIRVWAKHKHLKARHEGVERVTIEQVKPVELQDWNAVAKDIMNLKF